MKQQARHWGRGLSAILALALLAAPLAGCALQPAAAEELRADVPRDLSPNVAQGEVAQLVAGNSAFAFDLYRALRGQVDNLFYSPYSISVALAMTYAGARGETEREMAQTLHFSLPQERLHPAFNALDLQLTAQQSEGPAGEDERPFRLNIANSLWGQAGYDFLPEFLDTLARNYGAGMRLVDFSTQPEEARQVINQWISQKTENKIKDLIPPNAISPSTRLVLANAIYFDGDWWRPFAKEDTHDGAFHLMDGSDVVVPMMSQSAFFSYARGPNYQAIELPYIGDAISMLVLLPDDGALTDVEESLSPEMLSEMLAQLEPSEMKYSMPKFEFEAFFDLSVVLAGMGMPSAFGAADFSGMDGTRNLFISSVLHKAFVAVDEEGTEAAAATVVIMDEAAAMEPPLAVTVDRPFLFMILDGESGTILFFGRVLNPAP
jgi:serpin B